MTFTLLDLFKSCLADSLSDLGVFRDIRAGGEANETVLFVKEAHVVKTLAVDSRRSDIEDRVGEESHRDCNRCSWGSTRSWKAAIPGSVQATLWRVFIILGAVIFFKAVFSGGASIRVQVERSMS